MQSMLGIVSKVKLLSYKRKIRIDNVVFNLQTKVTSGILFVLSIIVTTAMYAKNPMTCIADKTVERVIDSYCYIHDTYTVLNKFNYNRSMVLAGHPGVGPLLQDDEVYFHKYYQWVGVVFFFQAVIFYAPRWLWKNWEGGQIRALVADVSSDNSDRKQLCLDYFKNTRGLHNKWSMTYAFCEILAFINVVVQIDFTDRFVSRALSKYGLSLFQLTREDPMFRTDKMAQCFPTVTKCTLNVIGPSGNIVPYDAICVLPFNIYNERAYPIVWIWFIFMATLSGLALVYRLATYLSLDLRFQLLRRKFRFPEDDLDHLWKLNQNLDYGSWYLLYQVGKNMGLNNCHEFLNSMDDGDWRNRTLDEDFHPEKKHKYL